MEPRSPVGTAPGAQGPGGNARVPHGGSGSKRLCGPGKGHSPGAPASPVAVGFDRETEDPWIHGWNCPLRFAPGSSETKSAPCACFLPLA